MKKMLLVDHDSESLNWKIHIGVFLVNGSFFVELKVLYHRIEQDGFIKFRSGIRLA